MTEIYDLGPMNPSAIIKLATIASDLAKKKELDPDFKFPRSAFAKFVAERITGEDRQDFSMLLSGKKGTGKSRSSLYIGQRVAEEVALIRGGTWKDYFSLENNCALLEDTNGINKLLKKVSMHQVVVIDDAGVAVGARDFATTKNKNFNMLLSICRTRRWFIIFNVPVRTHVDKQIRELVDCVARVYKPYHKGGFNILKIQTVSLSETNANKAYIHNFKFDGRKIDMWVAFSPDKDIVNTYENGRAAAADRIIQQQLTEDEQKLPVSKTDLKFQMLLDEYFDTIMKLDREGKSKKEMIRACPKIRSEHTLNRILSNIRSEMGDD